MSRFQTLHRRGPRVMAAVCAVALSTACAPLASWRPAEDARAGERNARVRAAQSAVAPTPLEIQPRRAPPPPIEPAVPAAAVAQAPLPPPPPAATATNPPPAAQIQSAVPAVASAPAAGGGRWRVARGSDLRGTLEAWAVSSACPSAPTRAWTVVWRARALYPIEAPHELAATLTFAEAADSLISLFAKHATPPLDWSVWTGNCAIVVGERPEGEGNAR